MADKVTLELATKRLPNKDPRIVLSVGAAKRDLVLSQDEIKIDIDLSIGYNEIKIDFVNKDPKDTILRDSEIVADLAVIVEHIRHRTIDFMDKINEISEYRTIDGTEIRGTHGFMAFNGTLKIRLYSPLFIYDRRLSLSYGR